MGKNKYHEKPDNQNWKYKKIPIRTQESKFVFSSIVVKPNKDQDN